MSVPKPTRDLISEVPMNAIDVSIFNTRKDLGAGTEDSGIDDLAQSIKEKGLLSPVIVRLKGKGKYELIAGQRRFLACKKLRMKTIPSIIRTDLDDNDAVAISLIENVHRAEMNAIDKAKAFDQLYSRYSRDMSKVSKQTGISGPTIKKYLMLLKLDPSIQEKITTSEGPAGIATLAKLAETFPQEEQEEVLKEIGGFKQNIQLEIIKRSSGSLEKVRELKEQAMEGAFDTKMCREGLCFLMSEELKQEIRKFVDKGYEEVSLKDLSKKLKSFR